MTLPGRLIVAAGLVWLDAARILVQRRPDRALHGGGLLELPGGKVEPGEAPEAALARELVEEWGERAADLVVGRIAEVVHHVYPEPAGPEILLCIYHVDAGPWRDVWERRVRLEPGATLEAHCVNALPIGEFLAADRRLLDALVRGEIRSPW